MARTSRYLFDLDFAAPPEPEVEEEIEEIPPEPMITVAEHERLLAEAVAKAHAEGQIEAREERELLACEKNVEMQKAILEELAMLYTEVGTLLQRLEKDASKLAFTFASQFAERLVAQEPKVEIQALLNQILAPLRQTPHIAIHVSKEVADEIRTSVEKQMKEMGFEGELSILPDPVMMPGDCEVEWVDGGIGRNLRTAIRQVEQLLDDHFSHVPDDPDMDEEDFASDEAEDDGQQSLPFDTQTDGDDMASESQPEQHSREEEDLDAPEGTSRTKADPVSTETEGKEAVGETE